MSKILSFIAVLVFSFCTSTTYRQLAKDTCAMWLDCFHSRERTQEMDFESQLFQSQLPANYNPNRDKLSPVHNAFVNSSVFNATWIHSSYCFFLDGLL